MKLELRTTNGNEMGAEGYGRVQACNSKKREQTSARLITHTGTYRCRHTHTHSLTQRDALYNHARIYVDMHLFVRLFVGLFVSLFLCFFVCLGIERHRSVESEKHLDRASSLENRSKEMFIETGTPEFERAGDKICFLAQGSQWWVPLSSR